MWEFNFKHNLGLLDFKNCLSNPLFLYFYGLYILHFIKVFLIKPAILQNSI